jgi:hypothetical protein
MPFAIFPPATDFAERRVHEDVPQLADGSDTTLVSRPADTSRRISHAQWYARRQSAARPCIFEGMD